MQYNTNSDAAIRAIIRACPTLIGQYRQAALQKRDRELALQQYQFAAKKQDIDLGLKLLEIEELEADKSGDRIDKRRRELLVQRLLVEIAEIEADAANTRELLDDALREVRVCDEELQRIVGELGTDPEALTTAEFQALMADEYREKVVRAIAAPVLAGHLGLTVESTVALLEVPLEERANYLKGVGDLLALHGMVAEAAGLPMAVEGGENVE